MLYFQQLLKENNHISPDDAAQFESMIQTTAAELRKLEDITDVSEENIEKAIYPK
jgi:hypothetical protein